MKVNARNLRWMTFLLRAISYLFFYKSYPCIGGWTWRGSCSRYTFRCILHKTFRDNEKLLTRSYTPYWRIVARMRYSMERSMLLNLSLWQNERWTKGDQSFSCRLLDIAHLGSVYKGCKVIK